MANPLNRFHLTPKTRTEKIEYFDYIPKISPIGDYTRIENIDVIINSWNNILLTPKGSYDHDPNYGSNLFKLVFLPTNVETQNAINDEIYNSLYYYDNRASIYSLNIRFLKGNQSKKGYSVELHIEYKGEIKPLTINIMSTLST